MERKRALRLKRWAFYLLLGMLPVLGGCGREQVADNMILTHKTVQAHKAKHLRKYSLYPWSRRSYPKAWRRTAREISFTLILK